MITGDLKSKIDRIWDTMWSGGLSNPLSVIDQLTYLLFIKLLEELHTLSESKAARTGKSPARPIFEKGLELPALVAVRSAKPLTPHLHSKEWDQTRGIPLLFRVLKVKRMFGVSYATVLYRVGESLAESDKLWRSFHAGYKRRYGRSLSKKEEPIGLRGSGIRSAEPPSANEPEKLSEFDFLPERLQRLVRQAVEKERISLDRAAEILGLSVSEMRQLARAWEE